MFIVSRDGEVWLEDGTLKNQYKSKGYCFIKHKQKAYRVHRLVAEKYLPNPNKLPIINHKDGDKTNNCVDNLEWCTQTHNVYHALRTGIHSQEEMPVRGIHKITGEVVEFISQAEASKHTPAYQANIHRCIVGERRSAGGYYWEKVID